MCSIHLSPVPSYSFNSCLAKWLNSLLCQRFSRHCCHKPS